MRFPISVLRCISSDLLLLLSLKAVHACWCYSFLFTSLSCLLPLCVLLLMRTFCYSLPVFFWWLFDSSSVSPVVFVCDLSSSVVLPVLFFCESCFFSFYYSSFFSPFFPALSTIVIRIAVSFWLMYLMWLVLVLVLLLLPSSWYSL